MTVLEQKLQAALGLQALKIIKLETAVDELNAQNRELVGNTDMLIAARAEITRLGDVIHDLEEPE